MLFLIGRRTLLLLAVVLCSGFPSLAVADEVVATQWSASQWSLCELRFEAEAGEEQPIDVKLTAELTHVDGTKLTVPGFWNGGDEYLVRFTPTKVGEWSYKTQASLPALDKQSGTVDVGGPKPGSHGGIVINQDSPRRYYYADGQPYSPVAFECDWLYALDAENPDDIPLTRALVDRLGESGFDQIVMNVFAYDVTWEKDPGLKPEHEYGSPKVFPFGGDNENPDHSQLNIEYFKRLDRVIEYLDQKQIVSHLMIYVWNKRVNWPASESEEDNRYFDYVVKRYQAYPNIVWDISKEALGYGHTDVHYISDRIERLRNLDGHGRLVTVHDYGYCRRFPGKVDFISVQLWGSELYGVMRNVLEQFPGKPILNIEHGGYEESPYRVFTGNYTSPEFCLERAYQCVFAGSYATHYWQGAAWNVIIVDIDSLEPSQRPKLDYYRHLRTLYDKYQLDELKAGGKHSNSGFCLHDGKDLYVYYVPKENMSMNLRLPKEKRGRKMTGVWFDPFTGAFGDPIEQEIVQWPIFEKPETGKFSILIVETH